MINGYYTYVTGIKKLTNLVRTVSPTQGFSFFSCLFLRSADNNLPQIDHHAMWMSCDSLVTFSQCRRDTMLGSILCRDRHGNVSHRRCRMRHRKLAGVEQVWCNLASHVECSTPQYQAGCNNCDSNRRLHHFPIRTRWRKWQPTRFRFSLFGIADGGVRCWRWMWDQSFVLVNIDAVNKYSSSSTTNQVGNDDLGVILSDKVSDRTATFH